MTDIETVSKTVTEFLQRVLGADGVRVVGINKANEIWDVEAEVFEESAFLKALGLPSRVKDKNLYRVRLSAGDGGRVLRTPGSGDADGVTRSRQGGGHGQGASGLSVLRDGPAAGLGARRGSTRRIVFGARGRAMRRGFPRGGEPVRAVESTPKSGQPGVGRRRDDQARENRGSRHAGSLRGSFPVRDALPHGREPHAAAPNGRQQLKTLLEHLEDKAEWGVKAYCDIQSLENNVRSQDGPVSDLNQAIHRAAPGRAFLLKKKREDLVKAALVDGVDQYAAQVVAALQTVSVQMRMNKILPPGMTDRSGVMILNVALLVANHDVPTFLDMAHALNERYVDQSVAVECSGPWPPYNFCDQSGASAPARLCSIPMDLDHGQDARATESCEDARPTKKVTNG